MISCPPNIMPASETLQKAWDEANLSIENGEPEKALDILRDIAWSECKNDTQRSQTSRYAADAGTLWGEMDVNAQKRRWQKAYKNYKTALDFNPKDKETRRRMNKLASMMDENGVSISSGFQMFSEGNPTPIGILSIVVATMIFLTSFKVVTEAIDPDGIGLWNALTEDESSNPVLLNSTVVLEISYVDSTDTRIEVDVEIEMKPDFAPIHVENFLKLTSDGKYDNTVFHRIIDDFMIQGGDIDHLDGRGGYAGQWFGYCDGQEKNSSSDCDPSSWTIPDETSEENPGLLHESCTISMAKTSPPNTGGSQFFLIPEDSEPDHLDGIHTVFGEIVSGCNHVTAISEVPTTGSQNPPSDPVNTVQLKNAYIIV